MTLHKLKIKQRIAFVLSASFIIGSLFFTSCKKTVDTAGGDALSPEELIHSGGIDTFALNTTSISQDSAYTDDVSNWVLGSMHDSKMGIMNTSFYTQFDYTGTLNKGGGGDPILDSVVLSLKYLEFYGNINQMTFQAFELNEEMSIDANYYRNTVIPHSAVNLVDPSSSVQTPDLTKEVIVGGETLAPQLRLKLDNAWGSTILNEGFNGSAFNSHTAFRSFFKGLNVSVQETNPTSGEGAILYLSPGDKDTKITFYYHLTGEPDQYNFGIAVTDECTYFNHAEFDNSGYPSANILDNPEIGLNQFYAQAFNLKGQINFPGVNNIPKNSVIHAALLELPVEYQTYSTYYPSLLLDVVFRLSSGVKGGEIAYSDSRKAYVFDIRPLIQEIVNGTVENEGLTVAPSKYSSSAERIIFNGQGTTNKNKPRLIIKYTTF